MCCCSDTFSSLKINTILKWNKFSDKFVCVNLLILVSFTNHIAKWDWNDHSKSSTNTWPKLRYCTLPNFFIPLFLDPAPLSRRHTTTYNINHFWSIWGSWHISIWSKTEQNIVTCREESFVAKPEKNSGKKAKNTKKSFQRKKRLLY